MEAAAQFDLSLFHIINGWCGSWLLDRIAWFAQGDALFKGGFVMAAYWWFWFVPSRQDDHRRTIIAALLGTILALMLARTLASIMPFRPRPLATAGIDFRPPSLPDGVQQLRMEAWSSFPSDHAAMFFALAYGLWRLSRPVGAVAMVFATFWVGFVRIYLGIHYPSDMVVGAAIGLACGHIMRSLNIDRAAAPVLAFQQTFPQRFYAAMFLVTYEVAVLFDNVRHFMHGSLGVMRAMGFRSTDLLEALLVGLSAALLGGVAIWVSLWFWQRPMRRRR